MTRPTRAIPACAVLAALALPAAGAPAKAPCMPVAWKQVYPLIDRRPAHSPYRHPPLLLGDSTSYRAQPELARLGFESNARGGRMWAEGLCVLRRYKRRHALPHLVVLALGTNWIVRPIDIERALTLLGPRRVLGLVTPRKKGGRVGAEPRVEKRAQRAQPHRIVVLDWVRRSAGHREYFDADHLHPVARGAHVFARLIARALRFAPAHAFPGR